MADRRLLALVLLLGCAHKASMVSDLPFGDPARRDREAPLTLDAVTATATGEALTPEALAARLQPARLVFVGEQHTNPAVHEAQRRLIADLLAAKRKVLVGLEMFPYTVQPVLDRWNRGELTEDEFIRESHWYKHWGFDWRYYREIFLLRAQGARFFAVNTPREVITAVRKKGRDKLSPEEAAHLPPKIDTGSEEHRRLFKAYFGEGEATHAMSDAAIEGMFQAQCAWDATMAWNALRALQADPDPSAVMVVLLGSGHVAFGLGAPRQAAGYASVPMATVIPVPLADDDGTHARVRASYADYVWGLPPESKAAPYPSFGLSLADKAGVPHPVVTEVGDASAAARAGVQAEDRVVSLDGSAVPDKETFLRLAAGRNWGDRAALIVERAGKNVTLDVDLARAPAVK
jgi:uncharacterized iron-regulated protein